jgi:AraC-like DNA-binding protein
VTAVIPGSAKPLCYSAHLVWPFVRLLQQRGLVLPIAADKLDTIDRDMRVPIVFAEKQLELAIANTGDASLGLLAGGSMTTGDCPALDYAISTAANVREAVETAMRHARLANDALSIQLEVTGDRALLRVASTLSLQCASAEFLMAGLFTSHVRTWPHGASELHCLFAHPRPAHASAYESTFVGAQLEFDAACYGFSFASRTLEQPMPGADPRLHAMAKKYASLVLANLPATQALLSEDIRRLLPTELAQGRADARAIAHKLHLSLRTMGRRLEEEGTSYKAVLDDVRHKLALHHLARSDVSIPEVAWLLGFADVTTFHRAFKRWTQQTPGSYRAAVLTGL